MARQAHYIKTLTQKNIKVITTLYRCQYMREKDILNVISKHRLNSMIKEKIIEKVYSIRARSPKPLYTITKKGAVWGNKNIPEVRHSARYQSTTAVKHNLKLAEIHLAAMDKGAQWLTEKDLQNLFFQKIEQRADRNQILEHYYNHEISATDGAAVYPTGEIELIEVVTSFYTSSEIASKESFGEYMSADIQYTRA